ncbi:hypothetical protein FV232_24760 [Methylobacterium sp. WL30]|nr:hypothetical protein FV225_02715 [Methylobacterium sp. WL93]TXN49811.1 hypothetical protein FV227_15005 [Methylobacterium sp. WL119]TXN62774.1 hypothetical protein FV232_24760 [Methylobacterium sp. WL30]
MSEEPETSVRMGIDEKLQRFNQALLGEDELGAVVRGHIYIESELIDFIRARLPNPAGIKDLEIDYYGRIKLAIALGLDESFGPSLKFVGTLRNRFAHRLDAAIGKQDADAFEKALGPHKAVTSEAFKTAHIKRGTFETTVAIKQQEPRDRVTLGFVTLWAAMAVAVYQAARLDITT